MKLLKYLIYFLQVRLESEEQMKQVLKEYEKTISELIADNKQEKSKIEVS